MLDMYTLAFSAFPGIGTKRFAKLVAAFSTPENAWNAPEEEVTAIVGKSLGEKFSHFRKTFSPEKYIKEIERKDIYFFTPQDAQYPILLKKIDYPPFILFAKGNTSLLNQDNLVAIVGTRKVTSYGQQVTEMLTKDLVASRCVIVSGMALGVDGIAHKQALKNNGQTIAVLGSGVDYPTPREHTNLYNEILENRGLIVSTFSPGEVASIGSFPARNAIIAGISQCVVVTEGAEDSGSLITAQYAEKFNRSVFAVPGQITSLLSKGTNNLIKNGAMPISSAAEILDSIGIMVHQNTSERFPKRNGVTQEEAEILKILGNGPLHFDEIARTIGKDSKKIGAVLSLLELKGIIKINQEGKYYL